MRSDKKISKATAQEAKDKARKDNQAILGQSRKNPTTKDKRDIAALNAVIQAADSIINEEE